MSDKTLTFTAKQLAEALNDVRCMYDLGPELIAEEVFAASAQQPAPAVPDGWKPTIVQGPRVSVFYGGNRDEHLNRPVVVLYADEYEKLLSMLAAAPAAPVAQGGTECNCPKIGERWNPTKHAGSCPVHDVRPAAQEPEGHSEAWPKSGDRCLCPACCRHRRDQSAQTAAEQLTRAMQALATISRMARNEACRSGAPAAGQLCTWDAIADMADAALAAAPAATEQPDTVKVHRELLDTALNGTAEDSFRATRELRALLGKEGE